MRPLAVGYLRLGRHSDGVLEYEGACGGGAELLDRREVVAFTRRRLGVGVSECRPTVCLLGSGLHESVSLGVQC